MMPNIQLNFLAIAVAVIVNFIVGFLWYTPLFGKIWGREMGIDPNQKPDYSIMIKGMVFMVIGNFFMAWVFAHNIAVWNPITWGQPANEITPLMSAIMAAVFTWIGFYFPGDLGSTVWEKKSWTLFFINTGYHFVSLLVVALIIVFL